MKKSRSKDRAAHARSTNLWSYATLIGVAGTAAIALVAALIYLGILPAARDAVDTGAREAHGRTYAAVFDSRLQELRRWLDAAAAAPAVREALVAGDPGSLQRAGLQLNAVFDFAERVDVYLPDTAALDLEAAVPISYAALDVIRRAQDGEFVGPEAIEGERRAIYAAHPVEVNGSVAGVVFAVIAPRFFLDPLAGLDPATGVLSLEQAFDSNHSIRVMTWGESGTGEPASRFELSVPHWTLVYEPGRRAALPAIIDNATPITFTGAFALFLIALVFVFARIGASVRKDAALLRDRLLRTPGAAGEFRLKVFADVAAEIADRSAPAPAPELAPSPERAPESNPPAEAAPRASLATPVVGPAAAPRPADLGIEVTELPAPGAAAAHVEPGIFRAYDIRGITSSELTEDVAYQIGRAFAAEARAASQTRVAVGRDGRHSSPALANALLRGLTDGGLSVVDIGEVPTPMLYYATVALETGTGIMITGSHNPPEYNGLKMMLGGETLAGARIQALRERIERNDFSEGVGTIEAIDLREAYIDRIVSDIVVAQPLRVVIDCGNGIAGAIAPELIRRLDCDVIPLYCEVDGDFPNHHPDPADPANLEDLITVVKAEQADLGIAFDGDGDRIGVVTASGRIIWPDRLMMLFAQDIVGRNPGADIVYDVKCSRHLNTVISELGGRPIMWKTGHSNIKAKLHETSALLGGEFSGHICFGERWYGFDDALYAAARLLEILGAAHESADALFQQFPEAVSTPELKIPTTEQAKFAIMERLAANADFGPGTLTTIDGLRVDYEDGWGLIRPSNTSPVLTLRFEADDADALERIQAIFAAQLTRIDPELKFRQAR